MRDVKELPAWERLLKRMIWAQIGEVRGLRILDFGSGNGATADHFAWENAVVAVEPAQEMLQDRWADREYEQIVGGLPALGRYADGSFDMILCHNVLEYIDDKAEALRELCRLLKKGGVLSLVKHNRAGRVMQAAVLLDDLDAAHALLNGEDCAASAFGRIRYYEDEDVLKWCPQLRPAGSFGLRTFWGLQQNQQKHAGEEWQQRMLRLELRTAEMEEYRRAAFFHHLLFTKEE